MIENPIPDDVSRFVLMHIDSVAEMEALMLLWRDPAQSWDAASLAQRLYVPETDAQHFLKRLLAKNLVTEHFGAYQYWRSSEELGTIIDRLAHLYKTYLIPITNLIHSKPTCRIQEFADAFVIRKDK